MRHLSFALIYVSFFAVIAFACWITKSAFPLLALLFIPEVQMKEGQPPKDSP